MPSDWRIPRTAVWLLVVLVVAWRVGAYRTPSRFVPVPEELRLPLAVLGLFFVACGLAACLLRWAGTTTPFLLYGLGGGIHWGGAVGTGGEAVGLSLLCLYLAASALSEAALLHLALVFPPAWRLRRIWLRVLYLPAALGAGLAPVAGLMPRPALEAAVGALLVVANLLGIAAGVVFIVRLVRSWGSVEAGDLALVVVAMLLVLLVSSLGGAGILPGPGEAYNLAHAAIPAALLWVLARRADRPAV